MHSASQDGTMAGSDSFWEPGNYKRTTKRIEDGEKLCRDFILLVQERANIEKEYAKQLKTWSSKWSKVIEQGPEYGTTEAAWKAVLVESDRRCELHLGVKDNLNNEVVNAVKNWQKDNYHRGIMQLKEKKEMEDQFKKAQKPWVKMLNTVSKSKQDYHLACKTEKTAINQERNASSDSSQTPDQLRKLQEKVAKGKEQVQKTKEQYELNLEDINSYNAKYMEDMTDVFERCQRKEAQRLQCFKDTLFSVHKCLNIAKDPALPQIYDEFYHMVNNADHEKDLRWWSNTHGVNMAMHWPLFEDYAEEFRDIATKSKQSNTKALDGNITLINPVCDDLPKPEVRNSGPKVVTSTPNNHNSLAIDSNGVNQNNPFDDEEWDESGDVLVDNGEPGVPVRALYDYQAGEQDELTFKIGDTFEKLEDKDEQGWCKGRKDGRVGLYPDNYVELL